MNINNFLVKTAIGINYINDTQCGFKLFREIFRACPIAERNDAS